MSGGRGDAVTRWHVTEGTPAPRKPTIRQLLFAAFLLDVEAKSAAEVARLAGYSQESARWIASRNLRNPTVRAAVLRLAREAGPEKLALAKALLWEPGQGDSG
jgi:hypothetical protein